MSIISTTSVLILMIVVIAYILIFILVTGKFEKHELIKSSYALGTLINLRASGSKAQKAIDIAINRLNEIDDRMSAFKESSDISKINVNAGNKGVEVNNDTYFVVKKSIEYSKVLEGTFDPTIRPLVKLWSIGTKEEKVPEKSEVEGTLKLVNYNDVIFDENTNSVMLKHKNQALDVGGIAKGFAADEVRDIFIRHNVKSALIDLGGNIFAFGSKVDGNPWKVGIQNPFKSRGEFIGILNVKNKSIVTSGNYERYFMKDGKRFHHILDPKTGYPSQSKIISATIISNNSIDGDGLSTGVYIIGIEKAMKIIEALDGIEAIFITEDKKIFKTSDINESIFTLTDKEFIEV